MLKNFKLATKLVLGFAVPVLAIIAILIGTYVVTSSIKKNAGQALIESKQSFNFSTLAQKMKLDVVQVQQWLTDISATRGQDGLDDGFDEAENSKQSFLSGLSKFKKMYADKGDQKSIDELDIMERAFGAYYEAGRTMAQAYVKGGPQEGNQFMADFDSAAEGLNETINPFIERQTLKGESALSSVISSVVQFRLNILLVGLFAVIFSILAAWLIIRSITRPVNRIINRLNEGADQVASASSQISSASHTLAEGSSEQAASIEETSSSLEEMSAMTKQNADHSGQANGLMQESLQGIDIANGSMKELTASMEEISKASEETSKIIKTIDEISFQTNLLALNAAVEAARAGEAGAGFAVVADEVRNLAMRAAEAASNTSKLIEETVKKISAGSGLVNNTSEAFAEVTASSAKVGELVGEIAAASGEQARGIEQVNAAVSEMDKVTQQNAATAEESASSSEEMNTQAEQIREMVAELVTLVEGATNTKTSFKGHQTGQVEKKYGSFGPDPKPAIKTQHEVNSQQIIPLDDTDF
jgi:methyl-accepting chemotaxis protein